MAGGIFSDVARMFGWVSRQEHETALRKMEGVNDSLRRDLEEARGVLRQVARCVRDFRFSRDQQIRLPPNPSAQSLIQEIRRLNTDNQHLSALMERAVLRDLETGHFVSKEKKRELLAAPHDQQGQI